MHDQKSHKMAVKRQHYQDLKDREDSNRDRINNHRVAIKTNINQNKTSVFENNKDQRF